MSTRPVGYTPYTVIRHAHEKSLRHTVEAGQKALPPFFKTGIPNL
jgi:hypothetical protein